ncbi:MAG: hypothetical protein QXF05_02810 [Thermofilaceae archaeon]
MPSRVPSGKVGVYVLLSAEVAERLRRFVEERYGRVSGGLSREVERAISLYLDLQQRRADSGAGPAAHTHTHTHTQRIGSRTVKTLTRIVSRMLDASEEEIPSSILTRIVTDVAGGDGRTVEKYTRLLTERGIIVPLARNGSGITIYRIDRSAAKELLSQHV